MILDGGLDQYRINVDADHVVPTAGQFSADATRATARIEDARPTPNHRVKQACLSSQVATGCRHRTETLDVPGRVVWVRRHLPHPRARFHHVCIVPSETPLHAWDLRQSVAGRWTTAREVFAGSACERSAGATVR